MTSSSKLVRIYIWVVSLCGSLIFCFSLFALVKDIDNVNIAELILFSCLIFIAELIPTKIPGTDFEMAMTMPLAINIFQSNGLNAMVVFASIPMLVASLITHKNRPTQQFISFALFNVSNFIISAFFASFAYKLINGQTLFEHGIEISIKSIIIPIALWTVIYNLINSLLAAVGSSIYNPQVWKVLLIKALQYNIPNLVFSIPFCILFISLYMIGGWIGILLLVIPLFTGRYVANLYSNSITAYLDTITSLVNFMQMYHPYTRGHQERVANMADMLAKEMRLSVHSLMYMRYAGLLHDIGKVSIDNILLDKTEKLSDDDWQLMKMHPVRSANIVEQMHFLDRIVKWIKYHHEKPDGSGYPEGLKSDSIPIEASIIAVVDAFDAMTGSIDGDDRRVYRTPLSHDEAIKELIKGKGTQFDPSVVDAFIRMYNRMQRECND